MGWAAFLLTYLVGGVTFLPLVVAAILLHAHLTFPHRDDELVHEATGDGLVQTGDSIAALNSALKEKLRATPHELEVAAGYFAVCREYTPMGINARPIERSTPVGSAMVAAPSPSVYQTMYRSIFDRKPSSGLLDNNNNISQRPKKAGNVFYVVLRHGHLMLFDDEEQLEVRHVVSLAHHDVSIYSGEKVTPEGELWIKRNAICLSRSTHGAIADWSQDMQPSKPFFLFSENCSAKEDFYFALLRNQGQTFASENGAPSPVQFEVKNIISLVQKIHSSEEYLQTRWLNAMIGRVFLGVHRTRDMEQLIRDKLTKKISRVKRPTFLSNIEIKAINTGESAPHIINPRLRDLTVEGECCIEADVRYSGNFRLEVATAARIDLGARFKAREVDLVLAVVVKKLEGHVLFKVKAPPSNRLWFSFQHMPRIEMSIEPIVSTRQITYTVILRQIESRIKEVIAETLVLPFWDDMPFFNTESKKWRGGIFHQDSEETTTAGSAVPQGDTGEADVPQDNQSNQDMQFPPIEKSHSMPVIESQSDTMLYARKGSQMSSIERSSTAALSTGVDARTEIKAEPKCESPRPAWSGSFAQPPTPTVGTDATNADRFKPSTSPANDSAAITAMASLSARSQNTSPTASLTTSSSTYKPYITSKSSSRSSSREATDTEKDSENNPRPCRPWTAKASSMAGHDAPRPVSPTPSGRDFVRNHAGGSTRASFNRRENTGQAEHLASSSSIPNESHKRTALAAVTNVAASAKRWGLNALQRRAEAGLAKGGNNETESAVDLSQPMGRGQPLPPPGTPLPMPDKRSKTTPVPLPNRKPLPSPTVSDPSTEEPERAMGKKPEGRKTLPPRVPNQRPQQEDGPSLAKRRQKEDQRDNEKLPAVAAPADLSPPSTPMYGCQNPHAGPWTEDALDDLIELDEGLNKRARNRDPASTLIPPDIYPRRQLGEKELQVVAEGSVEDEAYDAWVGNDA